MFKKIVVTALAVLAFAIVIVLGVAATKPDNFQVARTTNIKALPEKIYPLVNDFHNFGTWSPWEKLDPAMKRTFSGPASGKGAVYAWEGNGEVGAGRMEIVDTVPSSKVVIKLDFIKPFEGHNIAEYTLEPQGDSTRITWTMHGPSPFVSKVMQVFISMDSMIGKDFETGLASMKTAAEK